MPYSFRFPTAHANWQNEVSVVKGSPDEIELVVKTVVNHGRDLPAR